MSSSVKPSVRMPHQPRSDIQILHQCENFLIVNKPADLRINSDEPSDYTVATSLATQRPHLVDSSVAHQFRFVHRLDYATSGVLCLALNPYAAKVAGQCFHKKRVVKHYVALVRGHVMPKQQTLHEPEVCDRLQTDPKRVPPKGDVDQRLHAPRNDVDQLGNEVLEGLQLSQGADGENESCIHWNYENGLHECRISVGLGRDTRVTDIHKVCEASCRAVEKSKPALTRLFLLQHGTYQNQPASKVLLFPETGRTHQLRVHCRYLGHLIVGDFTYSDRGDTEPYRMMLHSTKFVLSEAKTKRKKLLPEGVLDIQCPDPFTPEMDSSWSVDKTFATYTPDMQYPVPTT